MNLEIESMNIFVIAILFFVAILGAIVPFVTRKELFFGIRLEKGMMDKETMKGFITKYISRLLTIDVVLAMVIYMLKDQILPELLFSMAIIGIISAQGVSFVTVHLKVKKYKSDLNIEISESVVITTDNKIEGIEHKLVSIFWFAIPLIICAFMYSYNYLIYKDIPSKIPISFDFDGNITKITEKTLLRVFMMPNAAIFTLLIFIFVYFAIKISKKQLDSSNPKQSKERVLRFRRIWSIWTIVIAILMTIMLWMLNLVVVGTVEVSKTYIILASVVPTFIIIISVLFLSIYTGQGGSRLKVETGETFEKANRDDDKFWKLGMIYINKDDPAFMIEKRFGIGWTINFGNKKAVIGLLLFIIIISTIVNI